VRVCMSKTYQLACMRAEIIFHSCSLAVCLSRCCNINKSLSIYVWNGCILALSQVAEEKEAIWDLTYRYLENMIEISISNPQMTSGVTRRKQLSRREEEGGWGGQVRTQGEGGEGGGQDGVDRGHTQKQGQDCCDKCFPIRTHLRKTGVSFVSFLWRGMPDVGFSAGPSAAARPMIYGQKKQSRQYAQTANMTRNR